MAKEEEKPNRIIDQYKTGKITTAKFRKKMNELILAAPFAFIYLYFLLYHSYYVLIFLLIYKKISCI
ncbi:hypothetical protein MCI_01580 [Rickettsia montanensis str. OSU 85-930]|uniref:Uncharacterized protein n=1 Tax=Rickettsia montanensis (strain OSU 85-930) TaxID=1105114 RepID=H8KBJ6_RICMS|nr:hypothetical protein MCI_01580 [Rickettsia montanensis str. OSU 85-930]